MVLLLSLLLSVCQLPFLCDFDNKIDFTCPLNYCVVREHRQFSDEHQAIDLQAAVGTPVYAAEFGKIIYSGWECVSDPCALRIVIAHDDNFSTGYWHLDKILAIGGHFVEQGQLIGYTGMTGETSWPHVHFSITKNGKFLNPAAHIEYALVSPSATNAVKSNLE